VLGHPAREALAHLHLAEGLDQLGLQALLGGQQQGRALAQQQQAVDGAHDPVDAARDDRQQVVELEALDDAAADLEQGLELALRRRTASSSGRCRGRWPGGGPPTSSTPWSAAEKGWPGAAPG